MSPWIKPGCGAGDGDDVGGGAERLPPCPPTAAQSFTGGVKNPVSVATAVALPRRPQSKSEKRGKKRARGRGERVVGVSVLREEEDNLFLFFLFQGKGYTLAGFLIKIIRASAENRNETK